MKCFLPGGYLCGSKVCLFVDVPDNSLSVLEVKQKSGLVESASMVNQSTGPSKARDTHDGNEGHQQLYVWCSGAKCAKGNHENQRLCQPARSKMAGFF